MATPPPRSGMTLIELLVAIGIIGVLSTLLVVAVQKVRDSAARAECQNKLKQIAIALHGFQSQQQKFPPALSTNTADEWYLSWMGRIVPFLEQDPLGTNINQEYQRVYSPWGYFWQPGWGGQPPHAGFGKVLDVFRCSTESRSLIAQLHLGNGNQADAGFTDYLGVSGTDGAAQDGMLVVGSTVKMSDIPDGASNTLLVGERPPYQQWWFGLWYAGAGYDGRGTGDVVLGAQETGYRTNLNCPSANLGLQPGKVDVDCDQVHFWSWHSGGANFAFADGSVRFLSYSANTVLPALATRNGSEAIPDF